MNLQKILQFKNTFTEKRLFLLLLMGFFATDILFFNVNKAEWGDSYRILRASELLKQGAYPDDEKRPPLLSLVIASRPLTIDPVIYSRIVLFVFSLCSFVLFYFLARKYISNLFWLTWASLAF